MQRFISSVRLMTVVMLAVAATAVPHAAQADDDHHAPDHHATPLALALGDMGGLSQEEPSGLTVKQEAIGSVERPSKVYVTIEEKTPTDDSVAASRYRYILSRVGDGWGITSKKVTYRCVSGRGHTFFSSKLCR